MKRTLEVRNSTPRSQQAAFTLLDLLALLAVCGLLALMLVPAHAGSRSRAQSFRCRENLHQVMGAMLMYTHDNHDLFPPNPDTGTTQAGYAWCAGNVAGPAPQYSPGNGMELFNPDSLSDPKLCLVLPYLQSNITVFRCTADPRMGFYIGSDPTRRGMLIPATRTISMSSAVGTIDPGFASGPIHSGVPNLPVNGAWLDGTMRGNRHNQPWRTYGKTSDLVIPAPASLLVVTEEDPFSINDGMFGTCVATPEWVDWPSTLHNMAGVVSFADGHVELHKWLSATTQLTGPADFGPVSPTDPDWTWVAQHTSARAY